MPYTRGIMDAMTEIGIHTVVCMKSAQVAWTELCNNVIGYFIDYDPCPMLIVQPTIDMGRTWSRDRLTPMVRDTPALQRKVKNVKKTQGARESILNKKFPGGQISIGGANSPSGLAGRPVRLVVMDDVDRFPPSAGTEGNPIKLASKRQTTFWNRLTLIGSTPTVKGLSTIEREYEESDQRRYYVPCPHCQHKQTLIWERVVWPDKDYDQAKYMCESCTALIDHTEKQGMLERGEWVASKPTCGVAGFFINEVYSPFVTWAEMARNFSIASKSPEDLKTFVNTSLGETWEEKGEQIKEHELMARRENYNAQVPQGGLILVAGVDVQDDRFEVEVVAVGVDSESWSVTYNVIHGNMLTDEPWKELDEFLKETFTHESGHKMPIYAVGMDSGGHFTKQVYKFCAAREARRIFAVKGNSGDRPVIGLPTSRNVFACKLFPVGVDKAKTTLHNRLKIQKVGPGYCHFPAHYEEEYFKQLTSEKLVTVYTKGVKGHRWVPKNTTQRTEALDCRVYAMAILELLKLDYPRLIARFSQKIVENLPETEEKQQEETKIVEEKINRPPHRPIVKKSNFVTGWK